MPVRIFKTQPFNFMKTITLIFAAALFIGVTAASAQAPRTDTTRNRNKSAQQNPRSSSDQMRKDKSTDDKTDKDKAATNRNKNATNKDRNGANTNRHRGGANKDKNGDRTLVSTSDIPASLRETLQGKDYTGWESGQIYKTKNGEYILETNKNGMMKTHHFDANGKPTKR
jgi:hypothetical protein